MRSSCTSWYEYHLTFAPFWLADTKILTKSKNDWVECWPHETLKDNITHHCKSDEWDVSFVSSTYLIPNSRRSSSLKLSSLSDRRSVPSPNSTTGKPSFPTNSAALLLLSEFFSFFFTPSSSLSGTSSCFSTQLYFIPKYLFFSVTSNWGPKNTCATIERRWVSITCRTTAQHFVQLTIRLYLPWLHHLRFCFFLSWKG